MPNRVHAEPLGCYNLPFKVVADHPGLLRADAEHFHRMIIGPLLGLAEAVLALDLGMVETVFEGEPHDLARCGSAAPLVISANLTPNSFSRSRVSCASGNSDSSSSCRAF